MATSGDRRKIITFMWLGTLYEVVHEKKTTKRNLFYCNDKIVFVRDDDLPKRCRGRFIPYCETKIFLNFWENGLNSKEKKSWKFNFIREILWQGDPYGKLRDLCRVHREDTASHYDEAELTYCTRPYMTGMPCPSESLVYMVGRTEEARGERKKTEWWHQYQ